jgi:hypothetical protein
MVNKLADRRQASPEALGAETSWGRAWLPLAVAVPLLAAAVLPLVFEVVREIPPNYDCGQEAPAGLERQVAEYREGYIPMHVIAFVAAFASLACLSVARRRRRGLPGIGNATGIALALVGVFLVAGLVSEEARVGLALVVFPAIGLVIVAGMFGAEATGFLALGLLLGLGVWLSAGARREGRLLAASTACWVLLILIPAHVLVVSEQGSGPIFC